MTMKLRYQFYLALYMDGRKTLQRVHRPGGRGAGGSVLPGKLDGGMRPAS